MPKLVVKNAVVVTPDQVVDAGIVVVENGRFSVVAAAGQFNIPENVEILDADGLFLTPGFIDLQCNGGFGHDFTADPTTIWAVAAHLPRFGVTSFLPTIITAPYETTHFAQTVLSQPPGNFNGAQPLGLHVEGPFLNPAKKGAHNPNFLRLPDMNTVSAWSPATGVRLVTLAPELPGALAVVERLVENSVVVSAGHSMARFDAAAAGFDAGIRYGTHLFNAMPPVHHREPGLVGALLADGRVTVGLIPDGVHVHPALVQTIWRVLGNGRLNLVTDAMAAIGMPSGVYRLGDFDVTVDATTATLPDGTLAGSIVVMDAAVRNLMAYTGCSLQEALPTVTTTPARLLGLEKQKGQIAPGFDADFVLLNPDLTVSAAFVGGQSVYQANNKQGSS